jgi:hypothetical protein
MQGPGKMIQNQINCKVTFNLFRPKDQEEYPYIIWTSHGIHTHPPPPGTRTPKEYIQGLIRIIQRINDPALTTSKYYIQNLL